MTEDGDTEISLARPGPPLKKSIDMIRDAVTYGQVLLGRFGDLEKLFPDQIRLEKLDVAEMAMFWAESFNSGRQSSKPGLGLQVTFKDGLWVEHDRSILQQLFQLLFEPVFNQAKDNSQIRLSGKLVQDKPLFIIEFSPIQTIDGDLPQFLYAGSESEGADEQAKSIPAIQRLSLSILDSLNIQMHYRKKENGDIFLEFCIGSLTSFP
jgi:hypothetical protein